MAITNENNMGALVFYWVHFLCIIWIIKQQNELIIIQDLNLSLSFYSNGHFIFPHSWLLSYNYFPAFCISFSGWWIKCSQLCFKIKMENMVDDSGNRDFKPETVFSLSLLICCDMGNAFSFSLSFGKNNQFNCAIIYETEICNSKLKVENFCNTSKEFS